MAAALAKPRAAPGAAMLALLGVLAAMMLSRGGRRVASHLPILRIGYPTLVAATGVGACIALSRFLNVAGVDVVDWLAVALVAALGLTASERARAMMATPRGVRVAVVGGAEESLRLSRDLDRAQVSAYTVVGRIAEPDDDDDGSLAVIGELGDLRGTVVSNDIDLVVLGGAVARLAVFDELAETCLDLRLQLSELSAFYEDVFGHVPTAEINAAWFANLVDAHAHHPSPTAKRVLDVLASFVLGTLVLPLLVVAGALVMLDGGPAIFAQRRIGEGGRPFRVYKLRTMRVGSGEQPTWTEQADPRTTAIGRFLRRSHIDELPQLWNVLRGEMSLVGPRPEQLGFVERLEAALPFYQRRHLIRPGLTGWAQVRCGYAGSEEGSAWKLCNDLYYVKYRSLGLDLLLMVETAGFLVFGSGLAAGTALAPWAGTGLASESAADAPPAPALSATPAGTMSAMSIGHAGEDDPGAALRG